MGFLRRAFGGDGPAAVYGHCDQCGRPVHVGEESVTVNVNRERFDGEAVTVLESEVALLLCAPCGRRMDAAALRAGIPVTVQREA